MTTEETLTTALNRVGLVPAAEALAGLLEQMEEHHQGDEEVAVALQAARWRLAHPDRYSGD